MKGIDKARNNFTEEIKQNELISESQEKVCKILNFSENYFSFCSYWICFNFCFWFFSWYSCRYCKFCSNNKNISFVIEIHYLLHLHNKITKKTLQQFNRVIIVIKISCDNYKNLVIITPPTKGRCADIPIKNSKNINYDIKFIVISNESLAKYKIKIEICWLLYGRGYRYNHKKITYLFIRNFKLSIKQYCLIVWSEEKMEIVKI